MDEPILKRILFVDLDTASLRMLWDALNLSAQYITPPPPNGSIYFHRRYDFFIRNHQLYNPPTDWTLHEALLFDNATNRDIADLEMLTTKAQQRSPAPRVLAPVIPSWLLNSAPLLASAPDSNSDCTITRRPIHIHPTSQLTLDSYLQTWAVVLVITHPRTLFPSIYRAYFTESAGWPMPKRRALAGFYTKLCASFKSMAGLYRRLCEQADESESEGEEGSSADPLVFEIENLRPDSGALFVRLFCERYALDYAVARAGWVEGKAPRGILSVPVIEARGDAEYREEWEGEFGAEAARLIEECVGAAMSDYRFLRSKAWKMGS